MTIAISINVGEGLVYACDSTSSFFDTPAGGQPALVQSFHHAQKLIQLRDYPIGLMTFGLGSIGARNLESLVAEFERNLLPLKELPDHETYTVETIAQNLRDFIAEKYNKQFPAPVAAAGEAPPPEVRPVMGVVVGGYSRGEFFADEFLIAFPGGAVNRTREHTGTDVGIRWWGVIEPISRLVLGLDSGVEQWFVEKGLESGEAGKAFAELRDRFRWNIVFDGMPLQDAIDLGVYLANVTIGHSRFVVGPPVCGGHVDVATITYRDFRWVRQKKYAVKSDSVFF
jgi:hypothetical protein